VKEELNQKVQLLHALLAVGSIPPALELLSLHPHISAPYSCISDGVHRLLHVAIEPIYAPLSPSTLFEARVAEGLATQRRRGANSRTIAGGVEWLEELERKSVRGYSPFPKQEYGDRRVRFFLDDDIWTDDIPVCETLDDFYSIVFNLLRFSGPRVGNDVTLLVKLARIGKAQFGRVRLQHCSC
jgi:THO complex subunit 2